MAESTQEEQDVKIEANRVAIAQTNEDIDYMIDELTTSFNAAADDL